MRTRIGCFTQRQAAEHLSGLSRRDQIVAGIEYPSGERKPFIALVSGVLSLPGKLSASQAPVSIGTVLVVGEQNAYRPRCVVLKVTIRSL